MTTDIADLAAKLSGSLQRPDRVSVPPWLFRPMLEMLVAGEPVELDALARTTKNTAETVRDALAGVADLEYDSEGRLVGNGLTLRETPHRFEVDGHRLYTWCALETLIFPAVLGRAARVESLCHATRSPIHVRVDPRHGVTEVEPRTAVVSVVIPDEISSVRAAFCDHVHFFAQRSAAAAWLRQHPGMYVVPVADAFELGRAFTTSVRQ